MWGIFLELLLLILYMGYLLSTTTPGLGHGVSPPSNRSWPWTWGISSRPFLPSQPRLLNPTHLTLTSHPCLCVGDSRPRSWRDEKASCPDRHGTHMHVFTQEKFILDDGCVFLSEGHWMGFYLKSPGGVFFCWFSKMKGVAWGQVNTLPDLVSPGPPRGCKVLNCPHSFFNLLNKQITELLWASISSSIEWEKSVSPTRPNLRELCYHLIANIK